MIKNNISPFEIIIIDILVLLILIITLYKKKLTLKGGLSAAFIGLCISFCGYEYFIILVSFYISSIYATDVNKNIKYKLLGDSYLKDKKRNAVQVIAKGFFPTIVALIIKYKFYGGMYLFKYNNSTINFFYGMYIGFYVSANADTWASEIGIASSTQPILITKLKKVPKGTNGAISLYGTFMSILGGIFITFFSCNMSLIRMKNEIRLTKFEIFLIFTKINLLGCFCGFIGSFIDSILGSCFQISIYDMATNCIISTEEYKIRKIKNTDLDNLKINGIDALSNTQVNFITGITTSILSGYFFYIIL